MPATPAPTRAHPRRRATAFVLTAIALLSAACGSDNADRSATLESPDDGANVAGGVHVAMTADGLTIEEAGKVRDGAGHFHVIIDDGCVAEGETIAKDADHVHFGKGQAEGTVYLAPGRHKLCLQVADGEHSALDVTDTVTVTAGISDQEEWCGAIGEVDELFTAADTNGDDFATRQIEYENLHRLIAQLDGAIDKVDAVARNDVAGALQVGLAITAAFVEGTDESSAFEKVQGILQSGEDALAAGAPWITETCGVDING